MNGQRSRGLGAVDPRHIGRFLDKEMPIDRPGMEMSKPGLPDLRRRKHTVPLPDQPDTPSQDGPPLIPL